MFAITAISSGAQERTVVRMSNTNVTESVPITEFGRKVLGVNWTRVEGVLGLGALLTAFVWFLGMPTGMAIGFGFGVVFVLDVIRDAIFGSSKQVQSELQRIDTSQ